MKVRKVNKMFVLRRMREAKDRAKRLKDFLDQLNNNKMLQAVLG